MKTLLSCAMVLCVSVSCGGGGEDGGGMVKNPNDVKPTSGQPAAITKFEKNANSQKVDKVGGADGQLTPDGKMDAAFDVTIRGPIIAILVDSEGDAAWQWDTYVGIQEVPVQMKALAPKGAMTGGIGVFENDKSINKADGSFAIEDNNEHHLTIYIADTGAFTPGSGFRLYAETPDHKIVEGPVAKY